MVLIDLYRHIGEGAELVVIKKAGHALNIEKPKEMNKLIQCFLVDAVPSTKAKIHHQNDLKSEWKWTFPRDFNFCAAAAAAFMFIKLHVCINYQQLVINVMKFYNSENGRSCVKILS